METTNNWMYEGSNSNNIHQFPNENNFLNFDSPGNQSDGSSRPHGQQNASHSPVVAHSPAIHSQNGSHQPSPSNESAIANQQEASSTPFYQDHDVQSQHQQHTPNNFSSYLGSENHAIDILESTLGQQRDTAIYTNENKDHDMGSWPMPELQDLDMDQMDNFIPHDQQHGLILNSDDPAHNGGVHAQREQHHHQSHSIDDSVKSSATSIPPTPTTYDVNSFSSGSGFMSQHFSPVVGSNPDSNGSIRPDVVFTPLVSPAVTPLDSFNHKHSISGQSFFSPLTSPALEAKSPMKHAKKSTSEEKKKYNKRKTPGSTPIVGPTVPGRIAKNSPVMKAKRSSYVNNISMHHHQQQQQQQQLQGQGQHTPQQPANYARSTSSSTPDGFTDIKLPESAEEVMAPPKSTSTATTLNGNGNGLRRTRTKSNGSSNQPATPATLMNFKFESSSSVSSSPVILPSNDNSRRSSTSTILGKQNQLRTIPPDTSSASRTNNDDEEDLYTKKASHKLAEQGRRNRMNNAISILAAMIPETMQATVPVPSKATTVELATMYIEALQNEVRALRERLSYSDGVSTESISPLETTGHP